MKNQCWLSIEKNVKSRKRLPGIQRRRIFFPNKNIQKIFASGKYNHIFRRIYFLDVYKT